MNHCVLKRRQYIWPTDNGRTGGQTLQFAHPPRFTASNPEPVAPTRPPCNQANSASDSQGNGKGVTCTTRGEGHGYLSEVLMYRIAAPWYQLSDNAGNGLATYVTIGHVGQPTHESISIQGCLVTIRHIQRPTRKRQRVLPLNSQVRY